MSETPTEAGEPARRSRGPRIAAVLIVLLALCAYDAWHELRRTLDAPETIVEITSGHPFSATLEMLHERGVLDQRQRLYLSLWARITQTTKSVRAGEYQIEPGSSALDLLRQFISGRIMLHEIRFIEGWRLEQAWSLLRDNPDVKHTINGDDPAVLMEALGAGDQSAEGQFFPDTYRFPKGTSDVALMQQARQAMAQRLAEAWRTRAPGLAYASPNEALVMASLIEKETAVDAERAEIAGVFLRRLKLGMKLQTDPSVIYGLGARYDGNLHSRDLSADTPYNSYTRYGLPPTPICLPGQASIVAALHPAASDALYFVSKGDGSHQFSATLDEHNAAVRHFQIEPHREH